VQIVVKATADRAEDMERIVHRCVRDALGKPAPAGVTVSKVFPRQATGHRGRLFMVRLPEALSDPEVATVLDHLRSDAALEYAEIPSPKAPLSIATRPTPRRLPRG
jgi:hypothetical protein